MHSYGHDDKEKSEGGGGIKEWKNKKYGKKAEQKIESPQVKKCVI